ncbi:MAG TPA: NAD(P)-dependent oxidoreductase [Candidimonas sp.]|nr:NAD(P)-dependent oxidoreductase [Candidimonas sp.]
MKLGFCGLGLMGAPMVRRLLAAGHDVLVWNRTPEKTMALAALGATPVAHPADMARECGVVCLCLFDAPAVEAVVFGPNGLAVGDALRCVVDHSSIPPDLTRAMAARLSHENGAAWIDAPVSGGVGGAEDGSLAIMAGGAADLVRTLTPLLMAYAKRVSHMGDIGAGQTTKLCNQTIVATTIAAIGEAIALATASGVDASRLSEALAGGWADSTLLRIFVPRMTSPPQGKLAGLNTMLKDLDTVAALAQQQGTPMPVSASAQQVYRLARLMGLGDQDVSQLAQVSLGRETGVGNA